ncbi:hypothetical protein OC834_001138 [Tilletia horrida]|nr:hypothetical protein OC834_001138 [Tilletia horrida]
MSEAVKAAIRAARQQQQQRAKAAPQTKRDAFDGSSSAGFPAAADSTPFRRNDFMADDFDASTALVAATEDMGFVQSSLEALLNKACQNGRLNLSSRSPALLKLPPVLFSLGDDDAPSWFSAPGLRWWERQDLRTLIAANGELEELDERVAEFRALVTLDLHNNRLPELPASFFQLTNLTSLTISHNNLSVWPVALLALDNLVSLDISHNKLEALWDDAAVESARDERDKWDQQKREDEHQGIWASLGRDTEKERKQKEAAAALVAKWSRAAPFRALKTLNLASNKLNNAALGLATSSSVSISWPPNLEKLDISDNAVLSPVVLASSSQSLARLPALREIVLAGNGISDEVFRSESADLSSVLPVLSVLDLQRCEIDDLGRLEEFFGTRFKSAGAEASQRELIRIHNRSEVTAEAGGQRVHVLLEGNPLREEIFKQKRGLRSATTTPKKPSATQDSTADTSEQQRTPNASQAAEASQTSSTAAAAPAKAAPAKEAWELEAEAGLMTEGQRRLARIQAARKAEAEAAAAGTSQGADEPKADAAPLDATASGSNASAKKGVNKTGLSDWDGEPVLPKYLQRRHQLRGTSDPSALPNTDGDDAEANLSENGLDGQNAGAAGGLAGNSAGSTLANAKLSVKKKEALGQVPCKFFRSNGCSAGAACPFAHTMPGDGHQKAICAYWAKGQCKFGHKCALLHILPGQPVSMDRKNKRAAQQAQNSGSGAPQDVSNAGTTSESRSHQRQPSKNLLSTNAPVTSQSAYPPPPMPSQHLFSQHAPLPLPSFEQFPNENFPGLPPGAIPWFPGVPPQAAAALLASIQNGSIPPPHPLPLGSNPPPSGPPGISFEMGEVAGMDLPFGLPDDLQHLPPHGMLPPQHLHHLRSDSMPPASSAAEEQSSRNAFASSSASRATPFHPDQARDAASSHLDSSPFARSMAANGHTPQVSAVSSSASIPVASASSSSRPVSVPFGRHREEEHVHSLAGSPALATRAFGTSPFSHPAGTSVFYSTSQDDASGRAQPDFLRSSHLDSTRSMSRIDDMEARERWARAVRGDSGRPDSHLEEAEHDENGEEFLPSSLSDLLTPAELERRKRSASQTANQRPLSFVGFSNLHAQHGLGHRQGQLSASSTSRMNNSTSTEVFGRSPSSVGRWPSGTSAGMGIESSSSLQQLYGRTQTTPTRHGQGGGSGHAGLGTGSAADLLSSSPSVGAGYQAPQSLPQSLANRAFLGSAGRSGLGPGDDVVSAASATGKSGSGIGSPWARTEPSRVAAGAGAGSSNELGHNGHASAFLLSQASGRSAADTRLGSRSGVQGQLGSSYRPSSSSDLLGAGLGGQLLGSSGHLGAGGIGSGGGAAMSSLAVGGGSSYDELGPVAPSSILPHRPSPLSLAAAAAATGGIRRTDSGAHLPSSASGSFVSTSTAGGEHGPGSFQARSNLAHASPGGGAEGVGPSGAGSTTAAAAWGGIAIPKPTASSKLGGGAGVGTLSHAATVGAAVHGAGASPGQTGGGLMFGGGSSGFLAQHQQQRQQAQLQQHRPQQQQPSRARNPGAGPTTMTTTTAAGEQTGASNSPMAVPTSSREDYDEAIFELE